MRLKRAIRRYVAMKHLMGKPFNRGTQVLRAFCRYLNDVSLRSVAKWHVLGFLEQSVLSDVTWLLKYRILKAFFEYWKERGELEGLPLPPSRCPGSPRTFVPYIYSTSDLRRLIDNAGSKRRPSAREFSQLAFTTILLFLYGTGARINETLSLGWNDVDLTHGTVTFRGSTTHSARTVPIGLHLRRSLRNYSESRAPSGDNPGTFFVRENGTPIAQANLCMSFRSLRRKAGISRPGDLSPQPRIQDLRRTFAVHCIREWLRNGKDLRNMLPILGAYLGHANLTSTEAYLAVTPERFLPQLSSLAPGNRNERAMACGNTDAK
jgi:integrase/recombinase XerD